MSKVIIAAQRRNPECISEDAPRDYRKELWIAVATAVARAEACRDANVPANWANHALAAFDKTFKDTP